MHRLRERGHNDMYGEFQTSEAGCCAFHTPEGLCRLQLECGEETLPRVCRVFPRMERYMPSGYLERSLSPACEGVLALLWDLRSGMPIMASREELWKSYVNLCNLYGFYRFLSVMSCREGTAGDRDELLRLMVFFNRTLIHNQKRPGNLRDDYFKNDSATLAHMAILLCG